MKSAQVLKCFLLLHFLFCGSLFVFSQNSEKVIGFHFDPSISKSFKIPFKLLSNLVIIKVQIDETDTLNFILDTGIKTVFLTDPSIREELNFGLVKRIKILGMGKDEFIFGRISIGHDIKIGKISAAKQNLVSLEEDILKLSEIIGIPIHGIIGYDIFERFVVKINYQTQEITFIKPEKYVYKQKHGEKFEIDIQSSKPFFRGVFLKNPKTDMFEPIPLLIDTGAGHAILLHSTVKYPFIKPKKTFRTSLGKGLNGNIEGEIGRINELHLGTSIFNNVLCSFPDSSSLALKNQSNFHYESGSIGGEILNKFIVTINYTDNYVVFKPIKEKLKQAFEYDMSGLTLRLKKEGFVIQDVEPNTPAYEKKILANDILLELNRKNVKEYTLSEIYKILSNKEGDWVDMTLSRKNEILSKKFKLKRLI